MEVVAESRISGGDKAGNSASLQGFPGGSYGKASACNMGDLSSIPGSGRSSGEGNGNPLQYPCLENHMDGGAWSATVYGVAKSRTRLSDSTFHLVCLQTGSEGSGHKGLSPAHLMTTLSVGGRHGQGDMLESLQDVMAESL